MSTMDAKDPISAVHHFDHVDNSLKDTPHADPIGTVRLIDHNAIVLIPTPSPDPRDPLNLPQWQKWVITFILSLFSVISVLLTSGMGPIFTNVSAYYHNDPKASDLMTYPTLFMGIGNLIAMPLALAIGRRPVFLASALVLLLGSIWCAASTSLGSHIAGRDIMSLAAGQSEALCPLIIQEIHFLHERSRKLAWFSGMQSIGTAALVIATSYLTASLGWRWWYGVFAIVSGVVLILSFAFIPESQYVRPTDAYEGTVHVHHVEGGADSIIQATTKHRVELDFERYKPRSLKHSLTIFHHKPNWQAAATCWYQMGQCILFPNVLWVVLMNSVVLGIYVVMVTEFATILSSPPYNFPFSSLGFVQGGQIAVSIIMVPLLGYGGDFLTRLMAKRNNGMSEPEYRLIPMLIPAIVVVISSVIFGMAGSRPNDWSPWAIIISYNAEFFGFIGVVLIGFTYSLDCYGERAAPILVLICAIRGFISFGISFGVTNFVKSKGYDGALNICAIVMGVVSALGLPVYICGKKIRSATMRYAVDHKNAEI